MFKNLINQFNALGPDFKLIWVPKSGQVGTHIGGKPSINLKIVKSQKAL